MKIAIDAMGGDHAPEAVLQGALLAREENPDAELILLGRLADMEAVLEGVSRERLTLVDAPEVIETGDAPIQSIRTKKNSSLVRGLAMVKAGEADAFVSAGSTGALMAGALFGIGRIKGIERPALAPLLPTRKGTRSMLIDCGANAQCRPESLLQFAQMGTAYMNAVEGVDKPVVALMNIGTEEEKGNDLYKEAHQALKASGLNFYGNLEARDTLEGVADVLVCDGFTGNMILKTIEGTAKFILRFMKDRFLGSLHGKLGALLLKGDLKAAQKELDYTQYGGAPLLGVKGVVIKAHGSSNDLAFSRAVGQATKAVRQNLVRRIEETLPASQTEAK